MLIESIITKKVSREGKVIKLKEELEKKKEILIISGLSGSGKTATIQVLLDFGYLILSNLEEDNYFEMIQNIVSHTSNNKIAFIINIVNKESFDREYSSFTKLKEVFPDYEYKQIFIKASPKVLINRYQETRKLHPFSFYNGSEISLEEGIGKEIEISNEFRLKSDLVIDTDNLSTVDTKKILQNYLSEEVEFTINITSFGFKFGQEPNSDFIFDLRSLPNPFYIENLRHKSGLDKEVRDYVFASSRAENLYEGIKNMIISTIPGYQNAGKVILFIGVGCTGGQHRSVAFAEKLYHDLKEEYNVNVIHREKERGNWK